MPQLLETIMLVCFGISWPISLYKNVKSGTAVGISPVFIIMIIIGYIAGISAKLMTGSSSYVLIAYILNLLMVSTNLGVYFHNKSMDKKRGVALA